MLEILILSAVAVWLALALRSTIRHGGGCGNCSGGCGGNCGNCAKAAQRRPDGRAGALENPSPER